MDQAGPPAGTGPKHLLEEAFRDGVTPGPCPAARRGAKRASIFRCLCLMACILEIQGDRGS